MNRLLLYVHFNKYNRVSSHVLYQLETMRPLFSKIIFISNSHVSDTYKQMLTEKQLIDDIIQRENIGFDFAAWRDGLNSIGYSHVISYDSVTLMNDTCFGPLFDIQAIYKQFETDKTIDFWGMTNNRQTKQFQEHLQSYFISFKKTVIVSSVFKKFWQNIKNYTQVQDVINQYETQITTNFVESGFTYRAVFDTTLEDTSGMLHPDFSYYNPTAILKHKVPFLKVKAVDANQHITPYLLSEIEEISDYPIDLIVSHMSEINHPDFRYLLGHKLLRQEKLPQKINKKIAIHLHVFYVDLLSEFLNAFQAFHFDYTLFLTTDTMEKKKNIEEILAEYNQFAQIVVTGNIGRDVLPMLKLKEELENYDYIAHFHTKKSKEADFWAGESWRKELTRMLIEPADNIVANFIKNDKIGLVIADIPTFFRYNKIVDAWNEHEMSFLMNELWQRMQLKKDIDFPSLHTFVMSYGTFVWFKYEALQPLFELHLTDADVPEEPLPQNSILHAIERLLVYVAWNEHFDFRISQNPIQLTAFIDNKLLNERNNLYLKNINELNHFGSIKQAVKYMIIAPAKATRYILKKLIGKIQKK